MIVGTAKETFPGETRVAITPAGVSAIQQRGAEVCIEQGAGGEAGFPDEAYVQAGATLVPDREALFQFADVVVQVRGLHANHADDSSLLRPGQIFVAQCDARLQPEMCVEAAKSQALIFALELIPRTTRAQSMDVLTSMSMIAGYKAVLLGANVAAKMFPLMMTAAGALPPARVLVIGAGVAGLQAIATARRLGAVVTGSDIRPTAKEEIESLGARFLATAPLEQGANADPNALKNAVAQSDLVVATASIIGKPAPRIITAEMVQAMSPGAVIVDQAAERGGNCELTVPDQTITQHGVLILGPTNLPAEIPKQASQIFSNNVVSFLKLLVKKGKLTLNLTDDIIAGTLVSHQGRVVHPEIRALAGLSSNIEPPTPPPEPEREGQVDDHDPDTYRIKLD